MASLSMHSALNTLEITESPVEMVTVKKAYRGAMRKWHPDKFQVEDEVRKATEQSCIINNAYEILTEHIEENGAIILKSGRSGGTSFERPVQPRHRYSARAFTPGFPDPTVFEVFMKSSNIVSAGYNDMKHMLYLKFNQGAVYEYSDVPRNVWEELRAAESHGRYANAHICRSFKYRRCHEPNQPYSASSVLEKRSKVLRIGG